MSDQQVVVDTTGVGNAEEHLRKVAAQVKALEGRLKDASGASTTATRGVKDLTINANAGTKAFFGFGSEAKSAARSVGDFPDALRIASGGLMSWIGMIGGAVAAVGGLIAAISDLARDRSWEALQERIKKTSEAATLAATEMRAVLRDAATFEATLLDSIGLKREADAIRARERRLKLEAEANELLARRQGYHQEAREAADNLFVIEARRRDLVADQARWQQMGLRDLTTRALAHGREARTAEALLDVAKQAAEQERIRSQFMADAAAAAQAEFTIRRAIAIEDIPVYGPSQADAGPATPPPPAPPRGGAGPRPGAEMAADLAWAHQGFLEAQAEAAAASAEALELYAGNLADAHAATAEAIRDEIDLIKERSAVEAAAVAASAKAAAGRESIWQSSLQAARALGEGNEEVMRAIAFVEGAVEQGRALAALASWNIVGFAQHQAAAVALFAAAGRSSSSGGGGGAGAGASRQPPAQSDNDRTSGSPQSIVILGGESRDPQDFARMVARGHRAAYYSGQGQRGAW